MMFPKLLVSPDVADRLRAAYGPSPSAWDCPPVQICRHLPENIAYLINPPTYPDCSLPLPEPLYILCHTVDRWMSYSSGSRDWSTLCGTKWRVFRAHLWDIPSGWVPCEDWQALPQEQLRFEHWKSALVDISWPKHNHPQCLIKSIGW